MNELQLHLILPSGIHRVRISEPYQISEGNSYLFLHGQFHHSFGLQSGQHAYLSPSQP